MAFMLGAVVTVTGSPAISRVVAETAVTVAIPVPAPGPLAVADGSETVTLYGHPACVATRIETVPPPAGRWVVDGLSSYVHPFRAGMLSTVSRNKVPKYFKLPDVRVK